MTREVPPLPPVIVDNGNSSYFIDLIDDMRWKTRSKRFELLVKWEGYETRSGKDTKHELGKPMTRLRPMRLP
jgi:hypothetical protein